MYCVRRVRLDSIGHRSARFGSLILDLTGGPSTVDGRPLTSQSVVDAILWLRNGGGKSSLLALLFSLLLPAKVDFIGHADDKSLADYIPDGKVSHVLVEWEDTEHPEAGATLVTGGVYQWQDGQCPADPSAGWDRLIRRWYLFRPAAGILDLDSIPIRHDNGQLSQSSFLRAIEETHKANRHVRLVVAKEQYQWAEQLQQYGLDPQVFKIQREMNKGEGGITDLFRFTTCEEFIDFLIDMVVNPAGPTAARGVLTEHADKLATRPARELEARFLGEATLRLRPVQSCTAELVAARHQLEQHVQVADRACEHIRTRAEQLRQQGQTTSTEADQARHDHREAKAKAAEAGRRVAVLAAEEARWCVEDAAQAQAMSAGAVAGAELENAAWKAVEPLLELNARSHELEETRELLARRDQEQAPLRQALERAGLALHAGLTAAVAQVTAELGDAKSAQASAKAAAKDAQQDLLAARSAETLADSRLTQATKRLGQIHERVRAARTDETLQSDEEPAHALQRLHDLDRDTTEQLHRHQAQEEQGRTRTAEIASERAANATALGEIRERHTAVWDQITSLQSQRRELENDPRLKELAGTGDETRLDLDSVGTDLVALVMEKFHTADTTLAHERAAAAQDERVRDAVTETGHLPASWDIEQAVKSLQDLGAPAITGLQFLRETFPAHRHDEIIETIPHLVGGIVLCGPVPGDDLAALVRRANVAPTSVVAVSVDTQARQLLADAPTGPSTVLPIHPGTLNPQAAEDELQRVTRRLDSLTDRLCSITERREADRRLAQHLTDHLAEFGPLPRAALETTFDRLDTQLTAVQNRERDLAREDKETESALHHTAQQIKHCNGELLRLATLLPQVRVLAADTEAIPGLETGIEDANEEIARQQSAGQECRRRNEEAQEHASACAVTIQRCTQSLGAWRKELAAIRTHLPQDALREDAAPPSTGKGTTAAIEKMRDRWNQAWHDWKAGISDDGLQRRLEACEAAITKQTTMLEHTGTAARERAAIIATGADAAEPQRRSHCLELAEQALVSARDTQSQANLLHQQATDQLSAAQRAVQRFTPPPAAITCGSTLEAQQALREARQTAKQNEDRIHERELAAERLQREADAAHNRAEQLLQAAQTVTATADRYREEAAPDGADRTYLTADALLHDQHQLTAHTARSLTPEQARDLQTALATNLDDAGRTRDRATRALDRATRSVELLSQQPEYTQVVDGRLLTRLQHDLAAPARLAQLLNDIQDRERMVNDQLAELAEDQLMVVQTCVTLVKAVLDDLKEVSRHSQLPHGLGRWSGQRFLGFEIRHEPADDELARRISAEIDRLISALPSGSTGKASALPEAITLTKRLVLAALGGHGNVLAKVIKPTQNLDTVERDSVTEIRKFSGGELLTVSVLLYCTLARMRAAQRDRKAPGGVGTLILDNPFGKANYLPFIGLQRRVAEAHGIQLVYTTGTNDLPALGRFPLIIRLRNGVDARTRNRYVQIADRYGDTVTQGLTRTDTDTMTSARLLRRTRPDQNGQQGAAGEPA
ncbi:hypothetical protein ACIQOW_18885 [Kitasatospora sp. NPDC091335]|uniref:hypothetical protein n=1 Tax=Kitasatospora sp. NPDC091335 TaxID=3364085 RepID=UPI003825875E